MTESSDPIIIVGAGIGGLFTALCLDQRGLSSVVLEKAEELTEIGAGIQIGANGSRLLHQLGLQNAIEKYASVPANGLMMDGRSGRSICTYPLNDFAQQRYELPHYQIRRADLQRVLVEALASRAPGSLKLGVALSEIRETSEAVEAVVTPAAVYRGRALAGCDGIHSRTRELMFGKEEPNFADCVAWRAVVPSAEIDFQNAQHPKIWIGSGRHIVQYPVASGNMVNIVACVDTSIAEQEQWQGSSSVADFRESFSDWCPEIQQLISKAEGALRWGLYERPVLDSWTSGRVTLLGDAAHAMLPSLAQGAVMSMEDGYQLAKSLAEQADTSVALNDYQSKRIMRTRKTQFVARKNMEFFHQRSLSDSLSVKALGLAGGHSEALIGNRYNWLYGYTDGS